MKTWALTVAMLAAMPASAGNTWITLHDGTNELVAELAPQGPVTVATQQMSYAFGESSTQIAVVSYDRATSQNQIRLIDKATRQVLATWPIPMTPVSLLSGAAPDVVLVGDTAYVLAHASILAPPTTLTRNERGGAFNILRVALRTGDVEVLPLGDVFANPRLTSFGGIPVVTDWAGFAVWRLATNGKSFESVIGREELSDILPAEHPERVPRSLPFNARADYVVVPGAGVFRLSRFGLLHRVAGPDLKALPAPHASMAVGPAQDKERLLAVTSERGPAIGMIGRQGDKRTLTFIDAASLTVLWDKDLPPGTCAWSMVAVGPDALLCLDTKTQALIRISRAGTTVLRELPGSRPSYILSAGLP